MNIGFTSRAFALLVVVAVLLCRLLPARLRPATVLAASYYFYWQNDGAAALAMLAATLLSFYGARAVRRESLTSAQRRLLLGVVTLLVGYLCFFKIAPFAARLLQTGGRIPLLALLPPLGISYYVFKLVGYLLDVYWEKTEPAADLTTFAAYVAFFPQIVAGPIQRWESFRDQARNLGAVTDETTVLGLRRILLGLFLKIVIADALSAGVDSVYVHPQGVSDAARLLAFYLYPLQLYTDFSGLTNIALGVGLLFGIVGPENFNHPFGAVNIADFWRRWHMSLTSWLTDYVFTPLRIATRTLGNAGLVLSILVNMVLIGLWHGVQETFLLFGLVHAAYLIAFSLSQRSRNRYFKQHAELRPAAAWLGPLLTFHCAAVAFVFFRAGSAGDAWFLLSHLPAPRPDLPARLISALAAIPGGQLGTVVPLAALAVVTWLNAEFIFTRLLKTPRAVRWTAYYVMIALVVMYRQTDSAFIYFRF